MPLVYEKLKRIAHQQLAAERLASVVECRFFAGLTETEASEALSVSERTVSRDWRMARTWLHEALRNDAA